MSIRGNRCTRCKCIGHNRQRCFISTEEAHDRIMCYWSAFHEGIDSVNNHDNHYLTLRLSDIRDNTSSPQNVIRSERNIHSLRAIRSVLDRELESMLASQEPVSRAPVSRAPVSRLHGRRAPVSRAPVSRVRPSPQMNKVQEILFDNSDKIPEGLYLELMNALVSI